MFLLTKTIGNNEFPYPKETIFSDAYEVYRTYSYVFLEPHSNRRYKSSIPIRFCPFCFVESIKNLGFFYFKKSWNIYSYCRDHKTRLIEVTAGNKSEAYRYLKRITSLDFTSGWLDSEMSHLKEGAEQSSFASEKIMDQAETIYPVKMAHCLTRDFGRYLITHCYDLEKQGTSLNFYQWNSIGRVLLEYDAYDKRKNQNDGFAFCEQRSTELKVLDDYLQSSSRVLHFEMLKQKGLVEPLLVVRSPDCEACNYQANCPASKSKILRLYDIDELSIGEITKLSVSASIRENLANGTESSRIKIWDPISLS